MRHKWIILAGMLLVAVLSGGLLGQEVGFYYAEQWAMRDYSVDSDTEYEKIIYENIDILENRDAVPAYKEMKGYSTDAVIEQQPDDWRLTLVNKWNPLDSDFKVELQEVSPGHKVDKRIVKELKQMIADAKKDGYNIYILSSYRTLDKQVGLYNEEVKKWEREGYDKIAAGEKAGTIVAFPGTSEHHLGLAVDLVSSEHVKLDQDAEKTKGYKWMVKNCHKYGFILRYPNDSSDVTGIIYEPWHFRYVGVDAATEIMEAGITLEEYLSEIS